MNVTARSYLTAGIAAVGAGAMVLAPVQPIPNQVALAPEKAVSTLAVELAASVDPWAAWGQLIDDTAASVEGLHTSFWAQHTEDYSPPFPLLTSILLNQYTYFSEFPDIGLIASQFFGNIGKFVKSGFTPGPPTITPPPPSNGNISPVQTAPTNLFLKDHVGLWNTLTILASIQPLVPALELLTTPISGALLGFAGPGLSAMLQLGESIKAIVDAPTTDAKLQAFFDLAPKVFNAGLNGGKYLDLLPITKKLAEIIGITIPDQLKAIGITTGGVLTALPYEKPLPGGYQAGGVAFDSIDTVINPLIGDEHLPGIPIGLIGAIQSMLTFAARDIYITPPGGGAATRVAPAAAAVADTPTEDTKALVGDTTAPAEDTTAPAQDTTAPAQDTTAPTKDTTAPAEDVPVVTVKEETPAATTGSPNKSASKAGGDDSGNDKGSPRHKRSTRGAA